MPKRGPRPAQTLPKWSPRPSQNHRLERFFGFYVPKLCLQRFRGRCFDIFRACAVRHVRLYVLPDTVLMGRKHVFAKSTCSMKMRKKVEETLPKPSPNPPQTLPKPPKIDQKSKKKGGQNQLTPKKGPRRPTNAKKVRKKGPKRLQKRGSSFYRRRTRSPVCLPKGPF